MILSPRKVGLVCGQVSLRTAWPIVPRLTEQTLGCRASSRKLRLGRRMTSCQGPGAGSSLSPEEGQAFLGWGHLSSPQAAGGRQEKTRALLTPSVQPAPYFSLRPSLCCESKRTPDFQEGSRKKWHHPPATGEVPVHHRAPPHAGDKQWPEPAVTCMRGRHLEGTAGVCTPLEGSSLPIRGSHLMAS